MSIIDDLAQAANERDARIRNKNAQKLEKSFCKWLGNALANELGVHIENGKVVFSYGDDTYTVVSYMDFMGDEGWQIDHPAWKEFYRVWDRVNLAQNVKRGPAFWREPVREMR